LRWYGIFTDAVYSLTRVQSQRVHTIRTSHLVTAETYAEPYQAIHFVLRRIQDIDANKGHKLYQKENKQTYRLKVMSNLKAA
jgi:hypothetical protein